MLNGVSPKHSPFAGCERIFQADATLANLEVPLTDIGSPTSHKSAAELRARSQFVLRADPRQAKWIAAAGIEMVSLGNNHAMDYGPKALAQEFATLLNAGIKHAGAGLDSDDARAVATLPLPGGLKLGLISGLAFQGTGALGKCTPATADSPGVNALDYKGKLDPKVLGAWVAAAHKHCDILIVALHGGIERQAQPTSYQVELAHAFIDAGADIVWGHHPHVLEAAEIYNGHPILYSMGNLVSPMPGIGGVIRLAFEGNQFVRAGFAPTRIAGGHVKPEKGAAKLAAFKAFQALCAGTAARLHDQPLALRPG